MDNWLGDILNHNDGSQHYANGYDYNYIRDHDLTGDDDYCSSTAGKPDRFR